MLAEEEDDYGNEVVDNLHHGGMVDAADDEEEELSQSDFLGSNQDDEDGMRYSDENNENMAPN